MVASDLKLQASEHVLFGFIRRAVTAVEEQTSFSHRKSSRICFSHPQKA
jgi:hypothetical protein